MTTTEDTTEKATTVAPAEDDLREAGFTASADTVKKDLDMHRKLRIAFEFYRVVKPEDVVAFNAKLKKNSYKRENGYYRDSYTETWQELKFTPIKDYQGVPPKDVIDKVREAQLKQCFDSFEIATIDTKTVKHIPDPIVFGRVEGSDLRFAVAQWDSDVAVEDLIGTEEGWKG